MKKLNQRGFSAVEGLLAVLILVVIAGVGYYVWHTNHDDKKNDSVNKTAQSSNNTAASKSTQQYFTIKEWGIRAPYSGNLTLDYTVPADNTVNDGNGHSYQYIYLSSKQLDDSNSKCVGGGYGGALSKYKSTDEYLLGESDADSGKTAAQYAATLDTSSYAHVGDYYYFRTSPQGICSDSTSGQSLQEQTGQAFTDLLPKFQTVN